MVKTSSIPEEVLIYFMSSIYTFIKYIPLPESFKRFSGSVGSGMLPGSKPSPSSLILMTNLEFSTYASIVTILFVSHLLAWMIALVVASVTAKKMFASFSSGRFTSLQN